MNFQADKIYKILDIKWAILEAEKRFPDWLKVFFKCGIVLFRRESYEKGFHSNDIQECEVEYAGRSDEWLLKNYNDYYKLITLRYGHLL